MHTHIQVHQDSGADTAFYLIDLNGNARGVLFVRGVGPNNDWEDMALGPCGPGADSRATCLFVGDIGDNGRRRTDTSIIRVREPDVTGDLARGKWFSRRIWGDKFYFRYGPLLLPSRV